MIINTGQRTDIPAFYSKWLMNRITEGYVLVRNPYNPKEVIKYILDPKVVDVLGFCTKNPRPMLKYLDELKDYGQLWYITITGFENDIELNVPKIDDVIDDFIYLSNKIGKNSVCLRYTPIIITEKYTLKRHIETFEYITSRLEGYTNVVTYGFLDLYPKLVINHPELKDTDDLNKIEITKAFLEIAKKHDMELRLCSKEKWLKEYGVIDGCMRISDYENSIGKRLNIIEKESRKNYCKCYLSNDIGAYNSCPHLCKYCYANSDKDVILNNYKMHDDNSPLLIGRLNKDDIIKSVEQKSNIDNEITLFDI